MSEETKPPEIQLSSSFFPNSTPEVISCLEERMNLGLGYGNSVACPLNWGKFPTRKDIYQYISKNKQNKTQNSHKTFPSLKRNSNHLLSSFCPSGRQNFISTSSVSYSLLSNSLKITLSFLYLPIISSLQVPNFLNLCWWWSAIHVILVQSFQSNRKEARKICIKSTSSSCSVKFTRSGIIYSH